MNENKNHRFLNVILNLFAVIGIFFTLIGEYFIIVIPCLITNYIFYKLFHIKNKFSIYSSILGILISLYYFDK